MLKRLLVVLFVILSCGELSADEPNAIIENKIILPKEPDTYMEARHIVLKGSNEAIGKAMADISKDWLGVKLSRYASPLYGKAEKEYLQKNYPILIERAVGVAKSYGVPFDDDNYVTSSLAYDTGPFACSAIFFPPSSTTDNTAILVRNNDFSIRSIWEMLEIIPPKNHHRMFSRNFVLELYPDNGYSSIVLGSLDLVTGGLDGINSAGLFVAGLVDLGGPRDDNMAMRKSNAGINALQLIRFLLDTCSSAEEAKLAILTNKIYHQKFSMHFLIGDARGNSFAFETSAKDYSVHFTDNNGAPQILTNHSVYRYPNVDKFPEPLAKGFYNTFNRYKILHECLKNHEGKFSPDDAIAAISLVWSNTLGCRDGTLLPFPVRTIWSVYYNVTEKTVEVKFYLKNGKFDSKAGRPPLILSEPYKFTLK